MFHITCLDSFWTDLVYGRMWLRHVCALSEIHSHLGLFSNLEYWVRYNLITFNMEMSTSFHYYSGTFGVLIIILFCFFKGSCTSFLCLKNSYWWVLGVKDLRSLKWQIPLFPASLAGDYKSSVAGMQMIPVYWWRKWGDRSTGPRLSHS